MNHVVARMLEQYSCQTDRDYENALKEIIQEIALLGLWRSKFFEHAAFYGGTALRILYQLDRFSEDLNFSLLTPQQDFNLQPYLNAIKIELDAFGFKTDIMKKHKNIDTAIQSAFLKTNTLENLLKIEAPQAILKRTHRQTLLKIKIEIDTDPPLGFETDTTHLLQPIPFWVKAYTLPDLFAGKTSAALARQWKTRVKGRDWYDFLWFIQKKIPIHLHHLEARLRYVNYYQAKEPLTATQVRHLLKTRVENLDISLAKEDISHFIKESNQLDGWSQAMFFTAIEKIQFV